MEIATLKISGIETEQCTQTIANALLGLAGVERASVSLASKHASINFDPTQVNTVQLKDAIRGAGFDILPAHGEEGNCCGSCGG